VANPGKYSAVACDEKGMTKMLNSSHACDSENYDCVQFRCTALKRFRCALLVSRRIWWLAVPGTTLRLLERRIGSIITPNHRRNSYINIGGLGVPAFRVWLSCAQAEGFAARSRFFRKMRTVPVKWKHTMYRPDRCTARVRYSLIKALDLMRGRRPNEFRVHVDFGL